MYTADNFKKADDETFILKISPDRDFRILQLTDLHLGFGLFSKKRDQLALKAVSTIVKKTKPDLIAITGDSVFPFFSQSRNAEQQAAGADFYPVYGSIPDSLCNGFRKS